MHCSTLTGHEVQGVRWLTDSTYVLRFHRNGLQFRTGQYLSLGVGGRGEQREYSIYSGEEDEYLEILVKEIPQGRVSKALGKLGLGDQVEVHGPFGFFLLEEDPDLPYLFVSTGTGISPFHSMLRTCRNLEYQLIHGVRYEKEAYDWECYDPQRSTLCLSRGQGGAFSGRVTDYLGTLTLDPHTRVYLCGNCEMIYEAYDLVKNKGISPKNIHTEVYF